MSLAIFQKTDLTNANVLVRADLNVTIKDGQILDDLRLQRFVPTLKAILESKPSRVVILTHQGRPKNNHFAERDLNFSTKLIAERLAKITQLDITFLPNDYAQAIGDIAEKQGIFMLENVRFYPSETINDIAFAKTLSQFGNVFINDAFSCSHRAHASIVGIPQYLPSYAGYNLAEEYQAILKLTSQAKQPVMGIIGGSKISSKISLLHSLVKSFAGLFVAGGMANTFLKAQGCNVQKSLVENDKLDEAKEIIQAAKDFGCELLLPIDCLAAKNLGTDGDNNIKDCTYSLAALPKDFCIFDVGPETIKGLAKSLINYETIFWNGPLGVYEVEPFAYGSEALAKLLIDLTKNGKTTIAGGGDTAAVINQLSHKEKHDYLEDFSYVSTAGGAFLEFLEGKALPGIKALEKA